MSDNDNKFILYKDLKKVVEEIKSKFYNPGVMLNKLYPKGSIVITYENKNPSEYIGGTWEAFGTGKTLIGVDTSQTEFNSVGKTGGGKKSVALGSVGWTSADGNFYTHRQVTTNNSYTSNNKIKVESYNVSQVSRNITTDVRTLDNNNNILENSLPPYITVYYWRRTDNAPLVMDFKQLTFNEKQFEEDNNVMKMKGWKYEGTLGASANSTLTLSSDDWTELKIIQSVNESGSYFNQCNTILKETFSYKNANNVYLIMNYNTTYYCNVLLSYSNKVLTNKSAYQSNTWVLQAMPVYSRV